MAEKIIPLSFDQLQLKERRTINLKPDLPKGRYEMLFSIAVPGYNPTHSSEKIKLVVE